MLRLEHILEFLVLVLLGGRLAAENVDALTDFLFALLLGIAKRLAHAQCLAGRLFLLRRLAFCGRLQHSLDRLCVTIATGDI